MSPLPAGVVIAISGMAELYYGYLIKDVPIPAVVMYICNLVAYLSVV